MKYVHLPLDEEIRSIGGYYKVLEEGTLTSEGREVLYVLKAARAETACCGNGGLGYISVPGYLVSYKSGKNEDDLDVSEVRRVKDAGIRKRLKLELLKKFPYITVIDFD